MARALNRRRFLSQSATAAAGMAVWSTLPTAARAERSPNEKLNIGIIGTAHRAEANIDGVKHENIVAVCDIDENLLNRAGEQFPGAKKYFDFRKLLEQKDIDAVVISTADHVHVPASVAALKSGRHVYCEKPLSHSVHEARVAAEVAKEMKLATQMGTQIHAENNYRRVVELIQAGTIGNVHDCHVWVGKSWSGGERPQETPAVPAHLKWDLWLGPAPARPYHPTYQPANWRRWWDFGGGTLGDMGCHLMDLPFWALQLRHPTTIESTGPALHPETTPEWIITHYTFGARGDASPVSLTWYDGGKRPPQLAELKIDQDMGVLFIGDKGMLLADYGGHRLLPESDFAGYQRPPESIPNSIGHYNEWIAACKTGSATTCNFDYSGALTEAVLLGNVAFRAGQKLEWDPVAMKATNCPAADEFIRREYRAGWSL